MHAFKEINNKTKKGVQYNIFIYINVFYFIF